MFSEEYYREFFALCKLSCNISLGQYLDRNNIFRSEFSNFMKGKYHNIDINKLEILKKDILLSLSTFTNLYKIG